MKIMPLIISACLVSASTAFSQSPPELFGSTWEVSHCFKKIESTQQTIECDSQRELLPGSLLGMSINENGNAVVRFHSTEPPAKLEIEATSWSYCDSECNWPTLTASFDDWSGNSTSPKKLHMIRFREGGKDTHTTRDCTDHLKEAPGNHMPEGVVENACKNDDLIYWRVESTVSTVSPPGDGHGTGTPPN
jgi:hypothetical protein